MALTKVFPKKITVNVSPAMQKAMQSFVKKHYGFNWSEFIRSKVKDKLGE